MDPPGDSWVDGSGVTTQFYAMWKEVVSQAVKSQTSYLHNLLNKLSMRYDCFYRLSFH